MSDGFDGCTFCRKQALHVEELEEKIRQLEAQLYGHAWEAPLEFGLTPCQAAMLAAMVANDRTVSRWFLVDASRSSVKTWARDVTEDTISTQICKMRQKLKPFGLVIQTVWGTGFRLAPETRNRLLNWNAPPRERAA